MTDILTKQEYDDHRGFQRSDGETFSGRLGNLTPSTYEVIIDAWERYGKAVENSPGYMHTNGFVDHGPRGDEYDAARKVLADAGWLCDGCSEEVRDE